MVRDLTKKAMLGHHVILGLRPPLAGDADPGVIRQRPDVNRLGFGKENADQLLLRCIHVPLSPAVHMNLGLWRHVLRKQGLAGKVQPVGLGPVQVEGCPGLCHLSVGIGAAPLGEADDGEQGVASPQAPDASHKICGLLLI